MTGWLAAAMLTLAQATAPPSAPPFTVTGTEAASLSTDELARRLLPQFADSVREHQVSRAMDAPKVSGVSFHTAPRFAGTLGVCAKTAYHVALSADPRAPGPPENPFEQRLVAVAIDRQDLYGVNDQLGARGDPPLTGRVDVAAACAGAAAPRSYFTARSANEAYWAASHLIRASAAARARSQSLHLTCEHMWDDGCRDPYVTLGRFTPAHLLGVTSTRCPKEVAAGSAFCRELTLAHRDDPQVVWSVVMGFYNEDLKAVRLYGMVMPVV
ncbi:MAG TPA: hypothetical protein VF699_03960 [Caulobacteraceae bacterium]|jgi:hypothetical protein